MKKRSDHLQWQQFHSSNVCFLLIACFLCVLAFLFQAVLPFGVAPASLVWPPRDTASVSVSPCWTFSASSLPSASPWGSPCGSATASKWGQNYWSSDTFVVAFLMTVVSRGFRWWKHSDVVTLNVPVLPLQGDMCNDCLCATFCRACSWCQMSREMKRRNIQVLLVSAKNTWSSQPKLHLHVHVH